MTACLFTVNVGDVLTDGSRASFIGASQRWQCDYAEIVQPFGNHHPCCAKASGASKFRSYDYLMYVDADTLINTTCPNPFEMKPVRLSVVKDGQDQSKSPWWEEAVYRSPLAVCEKQTGRKWSRSKDEFFNTGVMLWPSTYSIREMFEWVLRKLPENSTPHEEQAMINLSAWACGNPEFLSIDWNYIVPPSGPNKDAYINHFAGDAKPLLEKL